MCSRCPIDRPRRIALLCVAAIALVAGCEREARRFDDSPAPPPGPTFAFEPGTPRSHAPIGSPYLGNAQAISDGARLFEWYNCSGCHAHGGGDIGPSLMDRHWIYGGAPENLFATIMEGRPNGMPSFRGLLDDQQAWQLVAFVQTLAGGARFDVPPSRDDHLYTPWSPTAR